MFSIYTKKLFAYIYIFIDVTYSWPNGRNNWQTFLREFLSTPRVTKLDKIWYYKNSLGNFLRVFKIPRATPGTLASIT